MNKKSLLIFVLVVLFSVNQTTSSTAGPLKQLIEGLVATFGKNSDNAVKNAEPSPSNPKEPLLTEEELINLTARALSKAGRGNCSREQKIEILEDKTPIFESVSEQSRQIAMIQLGAEVCFEKEMGDWYKIKEGWIDSRNTNRPISSR